MKFNKFIVKNEKNIKRALLVAIAMVGIYLIYLGVTYLYDMRLWESSVFVTFQKFFNGFFILYIIFIAVVIFFENRDPSSTLAWLMVLILLPVVGFVFYIWFGRNIRKKIRSLKDDLVKKRTYNSAAMQKEIFDYIPMIEKEQPELNKMLIKLLLSNSKSPFTFNNKVKVLSNGQKTYHEMFKAIRNAKDYIHVEFFIIKDDHIGNRFRKLLINKAQQGVKVRLIYDSVGCWKLSKKYINTLRQANVEVYPFAPVIFPLLSRDLNYRNHRKIVVVDGTIGFVGGLNIGDEYLGKNDYLGFWRDTHIKVVGETVHSLQETFLKDWYKVSEEELDDQKYFPPIKNINGDTLMQIVSSGPNSNWQCIMKAYFTMIAKANEKIWITTPYLVPEESLRTGLIVAALSGVDVRIIIPNKPDHYFVYWASRDNIEELLEAGVKIYTYEKGFVHSKIVMVDSIAASVGTANFDYRSLEINYETNAFIYDQKVIRKLENDFKLDLKDSKRIKLKDHKNRGIKEKFLESLGRLVSPLQ